MPPFAFKIGTTVYVVDPSQVRWFEYNERFSDLTIYYHTGTMEVIRHPKARRIYKDLQLQFNLIEVRDYDP